MDYLQSLAVIRQTDPTLADELAQFHTLERLLEWIPAQGMSLAQLDLITQDEYSHDLLIPMADGSRWLSFAMT